MQQQTRAYLFAGGAILLWSTVATAFKLALAYMTPVQLLLYASLASTLVLGAIVAVQGTWRELRGNARRLAAGSILPGLLNPFAYYLVLFEAYRLLPAQQAQPLNYTWPIALALLSALLLGQRLSWSSLVALALSLVGVLLISTGGDVLAMQVTSGEGVVLAVGSSVIWALYWIYTLKDRADKILRLLLNFVFGTVFVLVYALLANEVVLPPVEGLLAAAYVGFFEMGITFALWIQALRHSRSTVLVGNLVYLSPFLSLIFISAVLGERILAGTVAGLVLIIAGILIQQRAARR
jgi:drug/metabolite transporter (DMT)-like permease